MGSDYSTFPTVSNYYTSMPTRSYNGSSKESCVRSFHTTYDWNKHLDNIKGSCQLMVIDFTASWCGPCKAIEPAFMELAAKFTDVIFVKIDVDELMSVAGEFGVEAMPTFVLIKHGKKVDKLVGAKKNELEKMIEMHRVQLKNPMEQGTTSASFSQFRLT